MLVGKEEAAKKTDWRVRGTKWSCIVMLAGCLFGIMVGTCVLPLVVEKGSWARQK